MNNIPLLITIFTTYLLSIICIVFIPFRRRQISKKTGSLLLKFSEKNIFLQVVVIVFCFLLISILFFRDLSLRFNITVCSVAFLGVFIESRELSLYNMNGVYEKGIISSGRFFSFSNISRVPLLYLDEPESEKFHTRTIALVSEKGTQTNLVLNSEEDGYETLMLLKTLIK